VVRSRYSKKEYEEYAMVGLAAVVVVVGVVGGVSRQTWEGCNEDKRRHSHDSESGPDYSAWRANDRLIVDRPSTRLGRAAAVSITQPAKPAKGNKAPDQPTHHARVPPESTSSSRCARFGPSNRPAPSELSSSPSPYPSNIFFAINALIDKALLGGCLISRGLCYRQQRTLA
jgi:hypothetical protein